MDTIGGKDDVLEACVTPEYPALHTFYALALDADEAEAHLK